jgi:stalled ribosome alternative rescue factor ArfA
MTKILSILAAILLPLSATRAAELALHLTRVEASELYVALSSAGEGLAPANAIAAADNINALRPLVEALDKGKVAYQRQAQKLAKAVPADFEAQIERLTAELEAKASEPCAVKLWPLALSDEEITATKLKPATLAVLRRWLLPAPSPAPAPPK